MIVKKYNKWYPFYHLILQQYGIMRIKDIFSKLEVIMFPSNEHFEFDWVYLPSIVPTINWDVIKEIDGGGRFNW